MLSDRPASPPRPISRTERRGSRRCKITQDLRIWPSDPGAKQFVDVSRTLSVSRTGVYFQTNLIQYEQGMRLYVTLPYSENPAEASRVYLAEVARIIPLPDKLQGVAIRLLMEMSS